MSYMNHRTTGQRTFYEDDNTSSPWKPTENSLIQQGFGRSAAFWYHCVPILAKNYRVIRRDALGHGCSGPPPANHPLTFNFVLGEMVNALNQLKIEKVHLICASTAGIFGAFMAAQYPDRLHSLTVCACPLTMNNAAQQILSFGYPSRVESVHALGAPA